MDPSLIKKQNKNKKQNKTKQSLKKKEDELKLLIHKQENQMETKQKFKLLEAARRRAQ